MNRVSLAWAPPAFFYSRFWLGGVFATGLILVALVIFGRLPPSDAAVVAELDDYQAELNRRIAKLTTYPSLSPVRHIWSQAVDASAAHGLKLAAVPNNEFKDIRVSSDGSAQYWRGIITGAPDALITMLRLMSTDPQSPYRPIGIRINHQGALAYLLVYGSTKP